MSENDLPIGPGSRFAVWLSDPEHDKQPHTASNSEHDPKGAIEQPHTAILSTTPWGRSSSHIQRFRTRPLGRDTTPSARTSSHIQRFRARPQGRDRAATYSDYFGFWDLKVLVGQKVLAKQKRYTIAQHSAHQPKRNKTHKETSIENKRQKQSKGVLLNNKNKANQKQKKKLSLII